MSPETRSVTHDNDVWIQAECNCFAVMLVLKLRDLLVKLHHACDARRIFQSSNCYFAFADLLKRQTTSAHRKYFHGEFFFRESAAENLSFFLE